MDGSCLGRMRDSLGLIISVEKYRGIVGRPRPGMMGLEGGELRMNITFHLGRV